LITERKAIYEENGVEEYQIVATKRRGVTVRNLSGKRFGHGTRHDTFARINRAHTFSEGSICVTILLA